MDIFKLVRSEVVTLSSNFNCLNAPTVFYGPLKRKSYFERCTHPAIARLGPYIYFWNRQDRKGQRCWMTARGAMNSCRLEFEDGYKMITSRNAIRRAK